MPDLDHLISEITCPVDCQCHTNPYAGCSVPGGCGSEGCGRATRRAIPTALTATARPVAAEPSQASRCIPPPPRDDRAENPWCLSGDQCRDYQTLSRPPHPAFTDNGDPFCGTCLDTYARDIRALLYDYVDLEQLQLPVLSQALDSQPKGKATPPIPLKVEPEALMAEIHYVLTMWEDELRSATGLPERQPYVRHGANVQRALAIINPRTRALSRLPATTVYPTGPDGDPEDLTGADAVLHLSHLHKRARAMLGRTRRTFWVPGDCWREDCCQAHAAAVAKDPDAIGKFLSRSEPSFEQEETPIYCRYCGTSRSYDDYQRYLGMLVWPELHPEPAPA